MTDSMIQGVLLDQTSTPHERAAFAVSVIEAEARLEFGVPDEVLLDIPVEWEHRVSGLAQQWDQRPRAGILFIPDTMQFGSDHQEALEAITAETGITVISGPAEAIDNVRTVEPEEFDKTRHLRVVRGSDDLEDFEAKAQQAFDNFWKEDK